MDPLGSTIIESLVSSHSKMMVCRFRTIPPIPSLKAAISVSQDWSIELLIAKIHDTILCETDGNQYLELLHGPNPSDNLLLELTDGCRLPTSESCAIVGRDQLVTVRLVAQPKFRVGPRNEHIHPRQHTSSHSNPSFVWPPSINSVRPSFLSHTSPSIHHLDISSPTNPTPRFRSITDRSLLDQLNPSRHRDPSLSTLFGQPGLHFHPINPSNVSRHDNLNPSPRVTFSSHLPPNGCRQQSRFNRPVTQNVESEDQSFFNLPIHPISQEQQSYYPSHHNIPHPAASCSRGDAIAPTSDVDPRLQSIGPQHDPDLSQPFSSYADQDLPEQQSAPIPFPSVSNSSGKPSQEEIERSLRLNASFDNEIPRVRSHIAGLRKSAARHYLASDYSRSSSEERNSNDSESDEFATFSRHARSMRRRTRSQSHTGRDHIGHFRPRRSGDSNLLSSRPGDQPARRAVRSRRKSLPSESSSESDWEETSFSSRFKNVDQVRKNRRRFFRESSSNDSIKRRSCPSNLPNLPSNVITSTPLSARPKRPILHNVRVVIPLSPSLVSPAYLKRQNNTPPDLSKQAHPPPPIGHPLSQEIHPSPPAVHSLPQEIRPSSPIAAHSPSHEVRPSSPVAAHNPSQEARPPSPRTHPPSDTSTPVGRRPSGRWANSSGHADKSFGSHSGTGLSSSSGRTTRSVYRIHIHDVMFKAASGQGPLRIPYSDKSSGLNDRSTLRHVAERLNLDFQTSWKLIVGDQVWLSQASSQNRSRSSTRPSSRGLLDGRIVRADWDTPLKTLGVFPASNANESGVIEMKVIRNWDLNK